jgi:hypothetical protein
LRQLVARRAECIPSRADPSVVMCCVVQVIQNALKAGTPKMEFMTKMVEVNQCAGIFVTLNPAGKGYGGRSKLPDNLKQLFRSVAMTVPDNDLIAEASRPPFALPRHLRHPMVT